MQIVGFLSLFVSVLNPTLTSFIFTFCTAIFRAEGIAAPLNHRLNEHISKMHKLKAQHALAMNEKVNVPLTFFLTLCSLFSLQAIFYEQLVIIGTEGGKAANELLQMDAVLANSSLKMDSAEYQKSREAILTELAIASGRGDVRILVGCDSNVASKRKLDD